MTVTHLVSDTTTALPIHHARGRHFSRLSGNGSNPLGRCWRAGSWRRMSGATAAGAKECPGTR